MYFAMMGDEKNVIEAQRFTSFISKLHEIYIVASQKFEKFGNECPHYTPSKAL